MKVLLVNPPAAYLKGSMNPRVYVPLGILSIARVLEQEGIDVQIYDAALSAKIITNNKVLHFGDSWEQIKMLIESCNPDIVGVSNLFSSQTENALKVCRIAKGINKNISVVAGGNHASVQPLDFLGNPSVDFVVRGEGEYAMLEIVRALTDKKEIENPAGICFKSNGKMIISDKIRFIDNLDELPLPAYHLIDMERYFYLQSNGFNSRPIGYGKREISIITSRGCPYSCTFCSVHLSMGRKWRAHSPQYVLRHIEYLLKVYHVDLIHFEDDNISLDRRRFREIINRLIHGKYDVKWDPPNGVRVDSLDEEILLNAKKSGCQYMVIAIESGVQRVLDEIIKKRINLKKVIEIAKICKKIKLELYGYYVIGFPGETLKDIKDTLFFILKMLKKYYLFPQISIATPLYGTELFALCKKNGYLTDEVTPENLMVASWFEGRGLIKTDEFSPGELKTLLRKLNRKLALITVLNCIKRPALFFKYIQVILKNPYLLRRYILSR